MGDLSDLGGNFDEVKEVEGFAPLPAGEYVAISETASVEQNRNQDGIVIKVSFQIVDGEFKGRKVYANFNWSNPNEMAQNIGRSEFKKFCAAIGVGSFPDETAELIERPLRLQLGIRNNKLTGEPQQAIKKFIPYAQEEAKEERPAAKKKSPFHGK